MIATATADRQVFLYQMVFQGGIGFVEVDEQDTPISFFDSGGRGLEEPRRWTRSIYQGSYCRRDERTFRRLTTRSRYA